MKSIRKKRTETVSIRLDPETRYLAELAAREMRRPLSSYIEWAVVKSLKNIYLSGVNQEDKKVSLNDEAEWLFSPIESHRLAILGCLHPNSLSLEERLVWEFLRSVSPELFAAIPYLARLRNDKGCAAFAIYKTKVLPIIGPVFNDILKALKNEDSRGLDRIYELLEPHAKAIIESINWEVFYKPGAFPEL